MKICFIILTALSIILFVNCSDEKITTPSESSFETVTIGTQIWMKKNLDVEKYRDGTPILHCKTSEEWEWANINKEGAWCYYDNDSNNGKIYGKLYNWYAVNNKKGLAPLGWKVATNSDWMLLINYFGGLQIASSKFMETGINSFSALPCGWRDDEPVTFEGIGNTSDWWTADENSETGAKAIKLKFSYNELTNHSAPKGKGFAIRCIKAN